MHKPLSDEISSLYHAAQYADVINMSWGFRNRPPDLFENAINFVAEESSCVLVASVGNESYTNKVVFPVAYDNVLAVGAVEFAAL